MFPRAIGRGGRRLCASGPVPEESSSSAPVPGQPSAPAAQPIIPCLVHFLGEKADGAQFAGVCQRSCGAMLHQRHFDPRAAAPQHTRTQCLAFQIIWLQGSTQTSDRTNRKAIQPTWPPSRKDSGSNRPRAGRALFKWEIQKKVL